MMIVSPLAKCVILSPSTSGERTAQIDRITIHCVVGHCSAEALGIWFQQPGHWSSNYGVDDDGNIGCYVPENEVSQCSSSSENDNRAITIETASDITAPYEITEQAYSGIIRLCADICKRYNKTRLLWIADKNSALSYSPAQNEMIITVHRWFAAKACPGDYIFNRLGQIAAAVTEQLTKAPVENFFVETVENAPEWARPTIKKLVDRKALVGTGDGLHLSQDLMRVLVILDRLSLFDRGVNM